MPGQFDFTGTGVGEGFNVEDISTNGCVGEAINDAGKALTYLGVALIALGRRREEEPSFRRDELVIEGSRVALRAAPLVRPRRGTAANLTG